MVHSYCVYSRSEALERHIHLQGLKVPVTCKIRVFPELEKTLAYARMLERAGCSVLAVHGRTREQKQAKAVRADWNIIKVTFLMMLLMVVKSKLVPVSVRTRFATCLQLTCSGPFGCRLIAPCTQSHRLHPLAETYLTLRLFLLHCGTHIPVSCPSICARKTTCTRIEVAKLVRKVSPHHLSPAEHLPAPNCVTMACIITPPPPPPPPPQHTIHSCSSL